jgi:heavy metal translocating P-type ATPase
VGASGDSGRAGWFLAKLGLAAVLSGNIMMFQSLLYFGSLESLGAETLRTISWLMLVLAVAVYALLGVPMLRAAYRAAREGQIVLETLIALGALAAIGASATETVRGGRHLYYDSGTMVLVFVVLGQYLDARSREKAAQSLAPAVATARPRARVVDAAGERDVAPEHVAPGQRVSVRAGEEIPVDGRILDGRSDVSEPALTGEAAPRSVGPGDAVFAGSVAVDGAVVIEANGQAETLGGRIERWTREARLRRAPVELTADRFVGRFVPAVALVALASALGWGLGAGDWVRGGLAALSVLVVACPCALGIATPMATTIAIGRAASRGTLLRSGAVLEAVAGARLAAFDKTGTITTGRASVGEIRFEAMDQISEDEILRSAAAVEAGVDHPFARAILAEARRRRLPLPDADEVRAIAGGGAEGRVGGRRVLIGSRALFAREAVSGWPSVDGDSGRTGVGVALDGRWAARILVEDPVRPEAREAVEGLKNLGLSIVLVSGDRAPAVEMAARLVAIDDAYGDLQPESKLEILHRLASRPDEALMIGDGVNDAPALAAAAAGVAFGASTGLAKQTADVVILREDLREVPRLVALAKKTMRIVKQNLVWAFGYNALGVLAAAFGLLRPVLAAAAMVLSSLFVVGNSLRLQRPPAVSAGRPYRWEAGRWPAPDAPAGSLPG